MNFRLYKPTKNHINLELFTRMKIEEDGVMYKPVMFLKPVGFFSQTDSSSNEIEVTIPKEFYDDFKYLVAIGEITPNIKVNELSLEANALLAAFSMEALVKAERYQDSSFKANGLDMDIYMTYDNEYPQSFLNDKYGLKGHIGAYFLKGENRRIDMNTSYKTLYWHLFKMGLMTAYKAI